MSQISKDTALQAIIRPTLVMISPASMGVDAERMLLAIALQESGLKYRQQVGGPARGLWQFEKGGGVKGVLTHPSSAAKAAKLCADLLYEADADTVHQAIRDNDLLACGFARLLLWTDSAPLPITAEEGWKYYFRNWRPGKPHPETWQGCWDAYGQ